MSKFINTWLVSPRASKSIKEKHAKMIADCYGIKQLIVRVDKDVPDEVSFLFDGEGKMHTVLIEGYDENHE